MIHSLFRHRCRIERATATNTDGVVRLTWATVAASVPCLLQEGSGASKSSASGNALTYSGILFLPANSTARPQSRADEPDRVVMLSPPRLAGLTLRCDLVEDECGMSDHLTAFVTRLPGE
jgi:hypothetical protein